MRNKLKITLFIFTMFLYINKLKTYEISDISIFGNIATQSNDIINSLNSKNMYKLNINNSKTKISNLPWIQNCIIKKNWPNKVMILIEEKIPIFETKNSYIDINGNKISKQHGIYCIPRIAFQGQFIKNEIKELFLILKNHETFLNQIKMIYRKREMRFDFLIQENDKKVLIKCLDNQIKKGIIRYLSIPQNVNKQNIVDLRHPQRIILYN